MREPELVDVLMYESNTGAPLYLRIQRFHSANVSELIDAGKKAEDYNHTMPVQEPTILTFGHALKQAHVSS